MARSKGFRLIIITWVITIFSATSMPRRCRASAETFTGRDSLDSFLHSYAAAKMPRHPHTGRLYDVASLPANLSDAKVSILRLRTRRLWKDGANFTSAVEIPPRVLPSPFTKRVDLVYRDLGSLSSVYYSVPNYTAVAPLRGFLAYDSDSASSLGLGPIELNVAGNSSFVVRFPDVAVEGPAENAAAMCVRFDTNGTVEFSDVRKGNSCVSQRQGHFSIVVPHRKGKKAVKWWMLAVVGFLAVLILFSAGGIVGYGFIRRLRMRSMERESVISEGLDTVWVVGSRMPSASSIRTQPELEENYVP